MASLPSQPRPQQYPAAGNPYPPRVAAWQPAPSSSAQRPSAPRRAPAGSRQPRLSKSEALGLVRDLKKAVGVGTVVVFGAFAALIAGRLTTANAANTSGSSNTSNSSNGSSAGPFSGGDNSGYFGQQNNNNGGSFGSVGGGGSQTQPVTGSSVS